MGTETQAAPELAPAEGEVQTLDLESCPACNIKVAPYFEPAMGIDRDGNTTHAGPRGMIRMVRKCPRCNSVLSVKSGNGQAQKQVQKLEQVVTPIVGVVGHVPTVGVSPTEVNPTAPPSLSFEQQARHELANVEARLHALKSRAKALRKILGRS